MANIIEFKKIIKNYPGIKALQEISFTIQEGSIHGLLGPNGAGKTTCMEILSGLIPPTSGEIYIFGHKRTAHEKELKSTIGYLPEQPPLYPNMKVLEYLKFVGDIHFMPKKERDQRIEELCKKCDLVNLKNRIIGTLSKGQRQKIGIAQALVFNPKIIILDEPTVGLDPKAIMDIRDIIRELKNEHTIILSSHQLHEIGLLCSDITIINKGKIVSTGNVQNIIEAFQEQQILKARVRNWPKSDSKSELIKIRKYFNCHQVEVLEVSPEEQIVTFYSEKGEDIRSKVSKYLINNNCDLLSFEEDKMDIEGIFKLATNEFSEMRPQ